MVGGTHYYTQSLLFQDALAEELPIQSGDTATQFPILDESTEVILSELNKVDPVMAQRWHPNDRRKIQRSLEIYLRSGKLASQIYEEQRMKRDNLSTDQALGDTESVLRFPTLLLWVHASREALHARLDNRIIKMLHRGLVDEVKTLEDFRTSHESETGRAIDQTRGIWVSIGYKEFLAYRAASMDGSTPEAEIQRLLQAAIEKTQAATRQYSNRQVRWIRIKLLNALFNAGQKGNMFLLNGSDINQWNKMVVEPAIDLTEQFLGGEILPDPVALSLAASEILNPKRDYDLSQRPDLWEKKECGVCGVFAVTENEWIQHVKSRAHRRQVGIKKKRENSGSVEPKASKTPQEDLVDVLESYQQHFPVDQSST